MKRLVWSGLLLFLAVAWPATAQSWDTSGNKLLSGTYYFRQVMWLGEADAYNDLEEAIAIYGTITFNGNGSYSLTTATAIDAAEGTSGAITGSGTYTIAASGYGYMSTPLQFVYSQFAGDEINLLVSNSGVVVGSTTDNSTGYNDMFIAAPVPSSTPSFSGTYSVIGADIPAATFSLEGYGDITATRSYNFQLTPNGSSGIETIQVSGTLAANGTATTQSISGASYSVTNGAAVVKLTGYPSTLTAIENPNNLVYGTKYFYFSPDGNFIFGGDPEGTDFLVGVRQGSGAVNFSGLYYTAGFFQDDSEGSSCDCAYLDNTYGSFDILSGTNNGMELAHQRDNEIGPSGGGPFDYTYTDFLGVSGSTYSDSTYQYFFGSGGAFAIGWDATSTTGYLGIEVLAQAPTFTASGSAPYIFPTGIVNAGSSVPFTADLVPGELISIYGANLAGTTATSYNLPTTLGNVQVLVNGTPGGVFYVSPGQIDAVIPLGIDASIASVQVVNGAGTSNTVSNYIGNTQPGVFNSYTSNPGPAVFHGNGTIVSTANPAQIGEELAVYLTGLGAVSSSYTATDQYISIDLDGTYACGTSYYPCSGIEYAGIEPGTPTSVGGGYQMNFTVPTGTSSGLNYLDIGGSDSYNSEAVICVVSCADSSLRAKAHSQKTPRRVTRPRFPDSPRVVLPRHLGLPKPLTETN
jgi:uncharacterized protein (TIGR03437 family)